MCYRLNNDIDRLAHLTEGERGVLMTLSNWAGIELGKQISVCQDRMALQRGKALRSIRNCLKSVEEKGYTTCVRKKGTSKDRPSQNFYTLAYERIRLESAAYAWAHAVPGNDFAKQQETFMEKNAFDYVRFLVERSSLAGIIEQERGNRQKLPISNRQKLPAIEVLIKRSSGVIDNSSWNLEVLESYNSSNTLDNYFKNNNSTLAASSQEKSGLPMDHNLSTESCV